MKKLLTVISAIILFSIATATAQSIGTPTGPISFNMPYTDTCTILYVDPPNIRELHQLIIELTKRIEILEKSLHNKVISEFAYDD